MKKKVGLCVLLLIVCACVCGGLIYGSDRVKNQYASIQSFEKEEVETNSNLEEFLRLGFELEGKAYILEDSNAMFYDSINFCDETRIEDPIFASDDSIIAYKGNVTYYCYMLVDGRIAFSDNYYNLRFKEVKKVQ